MNRFSFQNPRHFFHSFALFAVMMCPCEIEAAREFSTDRPDATESPFTLERGHMQLEASAASWLRERHTSGGDGTRVEIWNLLPFNLRLGLTPRWELQVVVDGHLDVKVEDRPLGIRVRQRGMGDTTLRAKCNFWGNDGGETAFGVMPFIKLPTASDGLGNDSVEGGIIFPLAMKLGSELSLGAMTELDLARNERDSYDTIWINTVTVGRDLTDKLGAFVELTLETGGGKPAMGFNTGLTFMVNEDLQLDAGVAIGLTRPAPDLVVTLGFSQRF
ncbi:MAG: transporter [Opitutaceae bacterium]|nr:transporter [Opitutaceae bacterium]